MNQGSLSVVPTPILQSPQPPAVVSAQTRSSTPVLFAGAIKNWKFLVKFLLFSLVFWLLELFYEYFGLVNHDLGSALVRSFALAGATYIGFALLSSSIFKFRPRLARYWYIRRSLGVMGFVFILFHALSVILVIYSGDLAGLVYSLNPLENPIIFGILAFPIFFVMAITSTDWAVAKLGYAHWKNIHRLVYFGYLSAVFHFLLVNPSVLKNIPGYLLLVTTFAVLAGELYWFLKIAKKNNFRSRGTLVGILIIVLYLALGYLAFFYK